ncbi:MAG: LysR family transcriptional regulator [Acidobacteria bacterium]|nr:LysR family transcriptional regulator [Acidobacteriota bacterium]
MTYASLPAVGAFFHFKLFRDIAHTGSMSRGAAMNGVSQSAASQHVQEREREMEVELIDRTRRPLRLTEAGMLYHELCRDLLDRSEEFDIALGQLKSAVAGTVRVASIFSVGLSEMSRLEEEFSGRFPQAQLEVEYLRPEKVYEAVRTDRADIGLVSYPHPAKDIAVIAWREEEMALAAAPSHAIAGLARVSPKEMEGLEFIGFDPDLPIRREVDRFLRDQGVGVQVTMHFDSIPMVKEALALGHCVSILPARMLQAEIEQGRLVAVPLEAPGLIRPLGIIHLKKKRLNRATHSFLTLLQQTGQPRQ